MGLRRIIYHHLVWLAVLGGCAYDRPVHPMRLEGFPGAPIVSGLFPLRDGVRWVFVDRLGGDEPSLRLSIHAAGDGFELAGATTERASIAFRDGFLEIRYGERLVERPLKLEGAVGDRWRVGKARCTVFGYDEIEACGRSVRALVVAVDRLPERDLYWFAPGMGWVRIRTERDGRVIRDVALVEFHEGLRIDADGRTG